MDSLFVFLLLTFFSAVPLAQSPPIVACFFPSVQLRLLASLNVMSSFTKIVMVSLHCWGQDHSRNVAPCAPRQMEHFLLASSLKLFSIFQWESGLILFPTCVLDIFSNVNRSPIKLPLFTFTSAINPGHSVDDLVLFCSY